MVDHCDEKNLAGVGWEEFFRTLDDRNNSKHSLTSKPTKYKDDVALLPYRKATCYGTCSIAETPKLVKCQNCNLTIKTVAFGHHQKIQHGFFPSSPTRRSTSSDTDSDEDFQGFLLSPPHHSNLSSASETRLDLKIIESAWTLSDAMKSRSLKIAENTPIDKIANTRQRKSPPCYDVQRRNDLRLVLTKRSSQTKMKSKGGDQQHCAPLVSISIKTRSNSRKRSSMKIAKQTFRPTQFCQISENELNGKGQKGCGNTEKWPNGDTFTPDLDESEQSSIPLHNSPSESSDSGGEENDDTDALFDSCSTNSNNYVQQVSRHSSNYPPSLPGPSAWDPRKAAERPSVLDKASKIAILQKATNKSDNGVRMNSSTPANNRLMEQSSFVRNQKVSGRGRAIVNQPTTTGNTTGMNIVEKLFKIQGISVTALSHDGSRKKPATAIHHTDVQSSSKESEPWNNPVQSISNVRGNRNQDIIPEHQQNLDEEPIEHALPINRQQQNSTFSNSNKILSTSRDELHSSSCISLDEQHSPSQSVVLQCQNVVTNTSTSDLRTQHFMEQKTAQDVVEPSSNLDRNVKELSTRNSLKMVPHGGVPNESHPKRVIPYFAKRQYPPSEISSTKQQTQRHAIASRKNSTTVFTGVSWRKIDSVSSPQSTSGISIEDEEEKNTTDCIVQRTPNFEGVFRFSSSSPQFYGDNGQIVNRERYTEQSHNVIQCHHQQQVTSPTSSFIGRKRIFPQQQMSSQQQNPLVKRFKPIGPRQNESAKLMHIADDKIRTFSTPKISRMSSNYCRSEGLHLHHHQQQHQQFIPNSEANVARLHPVIERQTHHQQQQQQQQIFSVLPSTLQSSRIQLDQMQHIEENHQQVFGKQARQIFALKQPPPVRQLQPKPSPYDVYTEARVSTPISHVRMVYDQRQLHSSQPMSNCEFRSVAHQPPPMFNTQSPIVKAPPCVYHQQQALPCQAFSGSADMFSPCAPAPHSMYRHSLDDHCASTSAAFLACPPNVPQQFCHHQQQCSHSCTHSLLQQNQPLLHNQYCVGGGAYVGMPVPSEPNISVVKQQQYFQQHQIPQPHLQERKQQHQQMQRSVMDYNNEGESEAFGIEPPPVLEAEGNFTVPDEATVPFEQCGGGATTRSESDASDMDLREILQQQQ